MGDQYGQVIDVRLSARRDAEVARRFFQKAMATLKVKPIEVVTDAAPVYPAVLDELVPSAWHHVEQYANNPIEADHGRLKHRLRPMRGLLTDNTAQVIIAGHASSRTYDVDTTNAVSASSRPPGSPPHSPNSSKRSDPSQPELRNRVRRSPNTTAPNTLPHHPPAPRKVTSTMMATRMRMTCRVHDGLPRTVAVDPAAL